MKSEAMIKAIALVGTQSELAKKCGKSQSTICDWLHGRKRISPEHVPELVTAVQGRIAAYEFRPDLPMIFPHPEGGKDVS